MQHIETSLANPEALVRSVATRSSMPSNATAAGVMPSAWLRRLWERMVVMYGAAWTNDNDDAPQSDDGVLTLVAEVWREGLTGITGEQMALGLQRCIVCHPEWPPRIGQFRALCLNVPTLTELRLELRVPDGPRSPFARLVFQNLDAHLYRTSDARTSERMLTEAYAVAREHVMRGGELPAPAVAEIESKPVPYEPPPVERRAQILERAQRDAGLLRGEVAA